MKNFAIYDEDISKKNPIGYLFYYEKAREFIIELCGDLNEWDAPVFFQGLIKRGVYTVPAEISILWVKERIIPISRQNIGMILKHEKLKEYDEMAFLLRSKGRCSQDNCYIKEVREDEIPNEISGRLLNTVKECFMTGDKHLICMFHDNSVRKIKLSELEKYNEKIKRVMKNEAVLKSVKVGAGGRAVIFSVSISISASFLKSSGILLEVTAQDFADYVNNNIVDTTSAAKLLNCSRQNIAYLVKNKILMPIKRGTKENLFTRGEITKAVY